MSKIDKQRFVDKFGNNLYAKFVLLKNNISHFASTDFTWHIKHSSADEIARIIERAENREYTEGIVTKVDVEKRLVPTPVDSKEVVFKSAKNTIYRVYDFSDMIDLGSDKYGSEVCEWCISGRRKLGNPNKIKVSQARGYFNRYLHDYNGDHFDVLITADGKKYCLVFFEHTVEKLNGYLGNIHADTIDNICWNYKNVPVGRQFLYDNLVDQEILDFYGIIRHEDDDEIIVKGEFEFRQVKYSVPEMSDHLRSDKDLSDTFNYKVLKYNSSYLCMYNNEKRTIDKHGVLTKYDPSSSIRSFIEVKDDVSKLNMFDVIKYNNKLWYFIGKNKFIMC